jgi:hypothetical protein
LSLEAEEYEECIACGRTDLEDFEDESEGKRSNGGIIFSTNGWETFLCSYCKYFIEGE